VQPAATAAQNLRELAGLFLRLGLTAFGGPAAHVAIMEDELVVRRGWLSRQRFLDLIAATNLIPGPNSTEMAIHVGYLRAGFAGLLVAGTCFILPAAILVGALGWAYTRFGALPQFAGILYGVKPVVIAVVLQALWRLGRSALKTRFLIAVGAACTVCGFLGVNELLILFGAGLLTGLKWYLADRKGRTDLPALFFGALPGSVAYPAVPLVLATSVGLWPLFLFFLKVGSVLFGSGYVLLAFLRADLVERWHWLSEAQLLDAVAVGQVTPGPVFTTATFIGYVLAGPWGAIVATVGIFLPAFVFVALSAPLVPRLRRSPAFGAVLDGLNAGSLALMAVVTWYLGRAALVDWASLVLACAGIVLLVRFRINPAWLVLGAAVAGPCLHL
jgi:chromate transporter